MTRASIYNINSAEEGWCEVCELAKKRELRALLFILGGKCYIFSKTNVPSLGGGKKRERKEEIKERGGGASEVAILQMGKMQVPINLTKPGPLRYCQPLRAKQIAGEISGSQARQQRNPRETH